MDATSELDSSVAEVEKSGLVCPVKKCRKHSKTAKRMLKHFRKCHPTKWILMCSHCSSYVTRKIRRMDRHFKENHHSEESFHLVCACHSSHKLDEAMFKDWSFSVQYSCSLCSFNTDDVKNFNIHTEGHFANNSESVGNSDIEASMINGSTKRRESLNSSEMSHSILGFNCYENSLTASSRAIYPCPVCGKCFTRKRSINCHMVVHTDERAFHCTLCPYKARRKGDLCIHLDKTHQHQRPYSCDICFKTFGFRTNLKSHLLTHSDRKEFKCEKCDARFKFKSSVTKHMKRGCCKD